MKELCSTRSVYVGMFEQTLLTQPASAQKTGAFAISLTAQMCVLGVLIIGPLLYTQTLPLLPTRIGPLVIDPPPPPPPPTPRVEQTTADRSLGPSAAPSARRIFTVRNDTHSNLYPTAPTSVVLTDEGPGEVDLTPGNVGVPTGGGPIGVPQFRDAAPTKAPTIATTVIDPPKGPVTVSGAVLASKLITKVVPVYPPAARAVHVSGVVRLLGVIGVDGHVKSLRVLEGHPLLRKVAEDAVWQWIYSPTTLSGRPVEVEASIEVNFQLN